MRPNKLKEEVKDQITKELIGHCKLAFILSEMRNHWRVMSREVALAILLGTVSMARKVAGKLGRMLLCCPKVTFKTRIMPLLRAIFFAYAFFPPFPLLYTIYYFFLCILDPLYTETLPFIWVLYIGF